MTTKRTPIGRPPRPHITPEMVELFVRHEKLQPTYYACIDGSRKCKSRNLNEHCPECREYLGASIKLHQLLGAKVWEISGVDADGPEPPPELHAMQAESWRRSWAMRCALEAAAADAEREQEASQ